MLLQNTSDTPSLPQSLTDTLARVMLQVEYNCFANIHSHYTDPFFKELCLIVSEVFLLNPESVIKINGSEIVAALVQEVYARLRNSHICLVFNNFQEVSHRVFNKKAYLRTALYNVVFEIESNSINEFSCDRLTCFTTY